MGRFDLQYKQDEFYQYFQKRTDNLLKKQHL